jgi:hypothetical protein
MAAAPIITAPTAIIAGMIGKINIFTIGAMIDNCLKLHSIIGRVKAVADKVDANESLTPKVSGTQPSFRPTVGDTQIRPAVAKNDN